MTTLKTTLNLRWTHAGWVFALLWYVASFIGAILYAIPVVIVQLLLGLDKLEDPSQIAQLSSGMLVLSAVLCGAACGSTIGLAQWFVLRRELERVGWWVGATIAGYASLGLFAAFANALQPGWLTWGATLIGSGKLFWLARVNPDWPASSWAPGALTYVLFACTLGVLQWLVLRRQVRRAGWWIAISAVGWAVAAALANVFTWKDFVLYVTALPEVMAAVGMAWLVRSRAPALTATL